MASGQTLHLFLLWGGLEPQGGWENDGDTNGGRERGRGEFERKWRFLDGVRVLGRVGGETKEEVVEGLYGWLIGEEDGEEEGGGGGGGGRGVVGEGGEGEGEGGGAGGCGGVMGLGGEG